MTPCATLLTKFRLTLYFIYTGLIPKPDLDCAENSLDTDKLPLQLNDVLLKMITAVNRLDPEEVLERLREVVIPGLIYSYLHNYISLLPRIRSGSHCADNLKRLYEDYDDLVFMLENEESECQNESSCAMIICRLLLDLLQELAKGNQQRMCISMLIGLQKKCPSDDRSRVLSIIPVFLEYWDILTLEAKIIFLQTYTAAIGSPFIG